jgi:hypothetical protein
VSFMPQLNSHQAQPTTNKHQRLAPHPATISNSQQTNTCTNAPTLHASLQRMCLKDNTSGDEEDQQEGDHSHRVC